MQGQWQGNHTDVFAQRLEFTDDVEPWVWFSDEGANVWGIEDNLQLVNAVVADDGTSMWAVYQGDDENDVPRLRGIVYQDNGVGARWQSWQAARRLMVKQEINVT